MANYTIETFISTMGDRFTDDERQRDVLDQLNEHDEVNDGEVVQVLEYERGPRMLKMHVLYKEW